MSMCFYLKSEDFINLEAVKETAQEMINKNFSIKLDEYDSSESEGGCFYIEKESTRGVHIFYEDDSIVVKINTLCNYADFILAKLILHILEIALEIEIKDEENFSINVDEYFTDEKIQELRENDAQIVLTSLKNLVKDNMQIFGVVRQVYFGKDITKELIKYENDLKSLVNFFDTVIYHVQYELPDYKMPGAALIAPKDSEDEKDFKKIRMMFEGNSYILQDYDYLMIKADENNDEIIFIDYDDISEIAIQIFKKDSDFEFADDFTIVFPKLEGKQWKKFVDLARKKNHKEMLDNVPTSETLNLTPDDDLDSESEDEDDLQCHGDHWDCILQNPETELMQVISDSLENGNLYGETVCDYILEKNLHGKVSMLEYDRNDKKSSIVVRSVVATNENDKLSLVSSYPVVKRGTILSLKITEIKEWNNGLEAWLTAEVSDDMELTFFDADYAINKEKYKIGNFYEFIIGAFGYFAEEPESKGFTFEGQKAIDFNAKMGKAPDYDEEGNVKPIEFSTENLCAFLQTKKAPDEAEFITTVKTVKSVNSFGKDFWTFNVIYRTYEDDEIEIPTFVLKSEENESIQKAKQLQGLLWLTGYLKK